MMVSNDDEYLNILSYNSNIKDIKVTFQTFDIKSLYMQ